MAGVKPDIPCERREIRHANQRSECAVGYYSQNDYSHHSLLILFQSAQKPNAAPRKTRVALQNTPLWKVRSSQRPTTTPMRMGATIVHPNRPIIASAAAHRPFSGPPAVLAPAMRPFNRFFQFAFVGPQLMTAMLLLGCHDQRPAVISPA